MKIDIEQDNLGILCICAIRYCMGRQTYMPELVRGIVKPLLQKLSDSDISVMIDDSKSQWVFGDERIDKPGWMLWRGVLEREVKRRAED